MAEESEPALGSLEFTLNRFTQKQDPRRGCDYKGFTQDLIQGGECGVRLAGQNAL